MTLSSVEAEPERCADFGWTHEKDEVFACKTEAAESGSQIRWVNPKEEEERKKLAVRLSRENPDTPTKEKDGHQQVKKLH